ncbi:DUF3108 domain-containing protein [Caenimonas sedimenti]|uniref:DUF3108 domain-containing protein n=1 Tax=Caenimonas sedimenti TaxID=2596921 RepID=A0A562ZPI1_9BURK|nr:DUF3108 domain-containing protein [Caenimonas sedimenti]TWO70443.1 DUF3108 domain-containing protein [Caenimonas sedimenti]
MAGSPGLIRTRWRLLLPVLVLGVHALALDQLARHLAPPTVLQTMAPPLYTRLLQPAEPAVVVTVPPAPAPPAAGSPTRATARTVKPRPAASQPKAPPDDAAASMAPAAAAPEAEASPVTAGPGPAPAETVAAATPEAAAPAPPSLDDWPRDTRLSYRLGGRYRSGDLYGDARVQWQREGSLYQVRVDIDVTLLATLVMTSQGDVTPGGLMPRAYEEVTSRKRRAARFGETALELENGRSVPRPAGVQDTASQFVELAHRFATGRETLEVGRSVSLWLARPGAVDRWTYDVVEREILQTPNLGAVEAFHLKPRPIANPRGNITAEMWFAPSLQYLPVRIRVSMGEQAQVDLLVDRIEQR